MQGSGLSLSFRVHFLIYTSLQTEVSYGLNIDFISNVMRLMWLIRTPNTHRHMVNYIYTVKQLMFKQFACESRKPNRILV